MFSIAEVQTKVIDCNRANKSCLLQVVHTKAIAALTQFCDFLCFVLIFLTQNSVQFIQISVYDIKITVLTLLSALSAKSGPRLIGFWSKPQSPTSILDELN